MTTEEIMLCKAVGRRELALTDAKLKLCAVDTIVAKATGEDAGLHAYAGMRRELVQHALNYPNITAKLKHVRSVKATVITADMLRNVLKADIAIKEIALQKAVLRLDKSTDVPTSTTVAITIVAACVVAGMYWLGKFYG